MPSVAVMDTEGRKTRHQWGLRILGAIAWLVTLPVALTGYMSAEQMIRMRWYVDEPRVIQPAAIAHNVAIVLACLVFIASLVLAGLALHRAGWKEPFSRVNARQLGQAGWIMLAGWGLASFNHAFQAATSFLVLREMDISPFRVLDQVVESLMTGLFSWLGMIALTALVLVLAGRMLGWGAALKTELEAML